MRKPVFCICEKENADQLRSKCTADHHLYFHYTDSTIRLLSKSKISSLYSPVCVELLGNPEDRFSHDAAHLAL